MMNRAMMTLKLTRVSLAQPRMAPMMPNRRTRNQKKKKMLTMLAPRFSQLQQLPGDQAGSLGLAQGAHGSPHGFQLAGVLEQVGDERQELTRQELVFQHQGGAVACQHAGID